MVKPLLIALALCLIPAPAYAHGIYIPEGLVAGVFGTLCISIGAALSLPGSFLRRILYFFAGLAGSALSAIVLMNLIILLANEKGRREGMDLYEMPVAAACVLAPYISAIFTSCQAQETKMLAKGSNRFLVAAWIALAVLSVGVPLFYGLFLSGYGKTFFAGTVAPFVSAVIILLAFIIGLAVKVNLRTDQTFRRLFIYWPFATLFVMLIFDTHKFAGDEILQIVFWYGLLLGYPVAATLFIRKRLKQRKPPGVN